MAALIHRFGLNGGPRCGAKPDKFGHLRISTSGVCITCPTCLTLGQPLPREVALAAIREAAKQRLAPNGEEGEH